MSSANIKNYAIAMEALSRIPGEEAVTLSGRIRDLLSDAIYEVEKEQHPPIKTRRSPTNADDEIPF